MKHEDLIKKMTLKEKADMCSGKDYWNSPGVERLGIPSIGMTDGPHGLRKKDPDAPSSALLGSIPSTCFPTAATTACSWDPELLYRMGEAMAEECLEEKVGVILGPGVNIKRSPLCGRNFEYFSEDPFLTGRLAAAMINGVQSKNVGTSIKHFAANSQEWRRMTIDSVVDIRALREIYLSGFEYAIKQSRPWTVMNAYNRLNGTYCAENEWLLTKILRETWGYEGVVVTDWGAENDRVAGLKAGQELEMPSSLGAGSKKIIDAVNSGELDESVLDESVDRVVDMILRCKDNPSPVYSRDAHHDLVREIAAKSMVLLKNEDGILPLAKDKKVALIGEMARKPRYQGAGSSLINPNRLDNAFDVMLAEGISLVYSAGYDSAKGDPVIELMKDAVECAKHADVAIVFAGLTDEYESEGFDRSHINMPESHNKLITAVSRVNPNTIVVLSGGSVVAMPWLGDVKAVLDSELAGEAGAAAVVDLLYGKVNPSGKLAETYPLALRDNPSYSNFPGNQKTVEYRESVYVGYRYYDTAGKDVLFPFGYGLSYTSFEYSGLRVSKKNITAGDKLSVSFRIRNSGERAGAEIAQLYVRDKESTIFRPDKELKGFAKVYLEPGEEKTVKLELDKRSFAFFNVNEDDFTVESGEFELLVGASSRDIRLTGTVNVTSDTPDAVIPDYSASAPFYYDANVRYVPDDQFEAVLGRPIPPATMQPGEKLDMTSCLDDAGATSVGRTIKAAVGKFVDSFGAMGSTNSGMIKAMALQIPVKTMVCMSMGVFSEDMAQGLLTILNGEGSLKGLRRILGGLGGAVKNIGFLMKSI